jgi:hypothetical protein
MEETLNPARFAVNLDMALGHRVHEVYEVHAV